jgi:hypothetical protein
MDKKQKYIDEYFFWEFMHVVILALNLWWLPVPWRTQGGGFGQCRTTGIFQICHVTKILM